MNIITNIYDTFQSFIDILVTLNLLWKPILLFVSFPTLFIFIFPLISLLLGIFGLLTILMYSRIIESQDIYPEFTNIIKVCKNDINDICSICLQDFEFGKVVYKTNCNHYYHIDCLKSYITINNTNNTNNTCPMCRSFLKLY